MNISSVIINLKDESVKNGVLDDLAKINECELVTNEGQKIISLINAKDIDDEIRIFRAIEAINGVSSVTMAFSYQEDLDFNPENVKLHQMLNDENLNAKNIVYNGHVGFKIK